MKSLTEKEISAKVVEVIDRESAAVAALKQADTNVAQVAGILSGCKGHILVAGAGTSRAMAVRFAHLLSCCGSPGLFISAADAVHGGAGAVGPGDVVYIISKGGQSAEINQFARIAKERAIVFAQLLGQLADIEGVGWLKQLFIDFEALRVTR